MTIETHINKYTENNPSLVGFGSAKIYTEDGMIEINSIAINSKDDQVWISLPSQKYTNKEGQTQYSNYVKLTKRIHTMIINSFKKTILQDSRNKNNISHTSQKSTPDFSQMFNKNETNTNNQADTTNVPWELEL